MNRHNTYINAFFLFFATIIIHSCNISVSAPSINPISTHTIASIQTSILSKTPIFTSISTITRLILSTHTFTITATTIPVSLGGGGKIVYSLPVGSGSIIYETYLYDFNLGREMLIITGDSTLKKDYSWSPDGKQIAFSVDSPEENSHIMILNIDTGIIQPLAYSKTCRNFHPSWSPDGKRIVYISDCDNHSGDLHIYVMNFNGTNPVRLTDFNCADPNWSPDGKKIAFSILQGENKGVYVMKSNGTNIIRLTNFGDSPQWSPDGKKIAFMYDGPINARIDIGIYIMNDDGSNLVNINKGGNTPSWSPDGSLLAISSPPDIIIIDLTGNIISILPVTPGVLYPMWSH